MSSLTPIKLSINGQLHTIQIEPDTPLLWVLRDHLNLIGTKFGCGLAQCGACTVVIDGQSTRSCMMPVQYVQNKAITTIEGLPPEHPIKQAWIDIQVPQCGYCQSGQMMSAYSLLSNKPDADKATIKDFMAGNICRCGTYPKILQAITAVQQQLKNDASIVQYFTPDTSMINGDAL